MKLRIICVGKTNKQYVLGGINEYLGRLKHYAKFDWIELPDVKSGSKLPKPELKKKEGELLLSKIERNDFVVVLDERGKAVTSTQMADLIQKRLLDSGRDVVFVIGGAFGFSDELYARADTKLSLSSLTFSHQMVRLFLAEQLYRAHTILRGEKYHH